MLVRRSKHVASKPNCWASEFPAKKVNNTEVNERFLMSTNYLWQLVAFVVVLGALNFFFHWHISIIGSLVLTLGLNFVMRLMQSKS